MNGNKIKLLAITLAALMLAGGLVFLVPADESDAASGDGGTYSYTLTYNPTAMSSGSAAISTADMTAISHANTGTLESMNAGSWTWDTTTGLGPFNSFYAAFDMTNGNAFYAVLNPYDLTKTVGGDSLSPMSNYNIMWVVPTVYWKTSGNTVTLTNDSASGGTAYAHTIDGHVYNYVAYGVYHGAKKTVGGVDVLTSESGVAPTASQTRAVFRDQANNYTMDSSLGADAHSMLWNFDMWTLYKLCCYAVMENFNSQATVGNGNVTGGQTTRVSGSLNTYGPYAGNNGDLGSSGSGATTYGKDAAKLFIEEPWGTVRDFVDGVMVNANQGFYIDSSSIPTDSTTAGGNVTYVACALPSSGWQSAISTNARTFGIGTATTGAWNTGLADMIYTATSGSATLDVGGHASGDPSSSARSGLSYADTNYDTSFSASAIGSRLALVFDEGLSFTKTATIESNNTSYGTVSTASIADIEPGTSVTISQDGLTLTIGSFGSSVATPTTSDAQYTYALSGWYVNNVALQTGDTIDEDVTIEARFTQTLNQYTVTFSAGSGGTVSPSSVTADYGTTITATDNVVTVGSTPVTATPDTSTAQYTYTFDSWTNATGTVTADRTITANFTTTLNSYTVTWSINGVETAESYDYGELPAHEDPAIEGYTFEGWDPEISTVTGNITYTAILDPIEYTVTFDAQGGTVDPASAVGSIDDPIALPTPTKQFYSFDGWYDAATEGTLVSSPYTPTADITLYAYWSEVEYTITFDANGGTVDTATLTGSPITAVTLPRALLTNFYFAGWYTAASEGELVALAGALMYPTEDVTYYAQYSDAKVYFNGVSFNNNGGYGAPGPISHTAASKGSYDFTIPETVPTLDGKTFRGWAKTSTESAKYQPGDTISVAADAQVTLYAIWEDQKNTNETLLSLIPLLIVIATVMIAATAAFKFRDGDYMGIIYLVIGIVVIIMLLTMFVIPVINEV